MDIKSQASISLSEQDFNDIHSAIDYIYEEYRAKGAKDFVSNLKKLDKKFWAFIRKMK